MSIRVVVADDEALARRRLVRLLAREPDAEVVAQCTDGRETVAAIAELAPDVVFLDVQMPELDGFAVVRALRPDHAPVVIFVTAFDRYALEAFEVEALDYLLKPFDEVRLRAAFARARTRVASNGARQDERILALLEQLRDGRPRDGEPADPPRVLDRVMIKSDGRVFFVRTSEIDWVEAEGNYVRVHAGTRSHLLRATMAGLEASLDRERFARIHRSTIVNLDRVREMQPWFSGEYVVLLHDGTQLRLSRWYRDRLETRMQLAGERRPRG